MICGPRALRKSDAKSVSLIALPCNRWDCPDCREKRKRDVQKEIRAGRPDKLLTFTLGTADGKSPHEHRAMFHHYFPMFMRKLCRKVGVRLLPYFVVVELHKSGHPHFHVPMRMPKVDKAWLQFTWKSLTGSHNVDIQPVRSWHAVASYLSEYLTKDCTKFGDFKRYWKSRNWMLFKIKREARRKLCGEDGWQRTERSYEDEVQSLMVQGFSWDSRSVGINRFLRPGRSREPPTGPPECAAA